MLDCFGVNKFTAFPCPCAGRVFSTSLNSYAFSRPCVGRIKYLFILGLDVEYLLVHGLDVLKTLFSFIQGFYLVFYVDEFALL